MLSWKGRAFFCVGSACTWGRRLPGMVPGHWWHCLKGPRVQERPIMCTVLAWASLPGQETRHCSWSITSYSIKGHQCSILETILLIKLALVGSVSCVDFQVHSHRFRFLEPWSGKAWGLPSPREIVANWNLYAARCRVPHTWNRWRVLHEDHTFRLNHLPGHWQVEMSQDGNRKCARHLQHGSTVCMLCDATK